MTKEQIVKFQELRKDNSKQIFCVEVWSRDEGYEAGNYYDTKEAAQIEIDYYKKLGRTKCQIRTLEIWDLEISQVAWI